MGALTFPPGSRVYLDSNLFIYALEARSRFTAALTEFFSGIDAGRVNAVTSELALAELMVKPLKFGDQRIITVYQEFLQAREHFEIRPVDRATLVDAAQLRGQLNLRFPDAIHAATARRAQCQFFLTNDRRLKILEGITVVLLSEFVVQ